MARGNYEILDYDSDGKPILPPHFDEPDACPVIEGSWQEHGGMVERVGLQYERASDIETIIEDALAGDLDDDATEDVREILEGEHDDDLYWLGKNSEDDDNRGTKDAHWASKLARCPRQRYYGWHNLPASESRTPYQEATYAFGGAAGKLVAEWMAKAGIYIDRERYLRQHINGLDYPITGKVDVVIEDPTTEDGGEIPVEAKSCSENSFDTFESGRGYKYWGTSEVPRKAHCLQLMSYIVDNAGGLGEVTEDDYGYLCYLTKNDHHFVVWKVYFNRQLFKDATHYCRYLEWHVENKKVPPRHPNAGLDLYVRGSQDGTIPPGGIRDGNFPCLWKGGRGRCDHLKRCYKEKLSEEGSPRLQEEVQDYLEEDITGDDNDGS